MADQITIRFEGTLTIDGGDAADVIRALGASGLAIAAAPTVQDDGVPVAEFDEVDDSPAAIAEAEALAAPTGWTYDLAYSWADEFRTWTQNGRILHELPIRAGGVATAEQIRIAAGRESGRYSLSGFTGGTAKRFKRWAAATPGAEGLTLPVETVYNPAINGRQPATGFKVDERLVPLFRIVLTQPRS